jgi:hypothetical protein
MTSQISGAVPGSPAAWRAHAAAAAARNCATRFSLACGAMGAAPYKAPVGGGVGGPRAVRGTCAPAAGAAPPRPVLPDPRSPRDFPPPPLHAADLRSTTPTSGPRPVRLPGPAGESRQHTTPNRAGGKLA